MRSKLAIRLLVLRFEPNATQLAEKLNHKVFSRTDSLSVPLALMSIQKSPEFNDPQKLQLKNPPSKKLDKIIAVSGNAVCFTAQALSDNKMTWPQAHYFSVGKRTQTQLQKASQQVVVRPKIGFNSEALLALPELLAVEKNNILILRGVGGREYLKKTLQARGAIVDYYQPYQRVATGIQADELIKICLHNKINSAIIFSIELLAEFIRLSSDAMGELFSNLTIYAPSKRITDCALQAGFKKVVVLPCVSDDCIINYFSTINE
jgi:uroporphyrinogen-III synthase